MVTRCVFGTLMGMAIVYILVAFVTLDLFWLQPTQMEPVSRLMTVLGMGIFGTLGCAIGMLEAD